MRTIALLLGVATACGGGGSDGSRDSGIDAPPPDAPAIAPSLTSFVATPSTLQPNVATQVTWTWTYQNPGTFPEPACSIDNGVGAVTRGQATMVTITAVTAFTITCTNSAGMAQRQVIVAVPQAGPVIATFTATPPNVTPGTPTNITWSWTYANNPSPAPTCVIEHGVGTVTPGSATSVTQAGTRVYRIRCANGVGTPGTATATVGVDECTAGTHECGANSTCVNTTESYACQCNANFVQPATSTSCSALVACPATPCGANATCTTVGAQTACVCNAGFIGDGTACVRQRVTFVTSASGTGNLATWADSGAVGGLAGADAVCQARANAAGLTTANGYAPFKAWLSATGADAYCRMHGLTGTKAANCGLGALPVAAGPWVNRNGMPFAPRIDRLLAPTRQLFNHTFTSESGTTLSTTATIFTGTDDAGVAVANSTCSDWGSSSSAVTGARGDLAGAGGGSWTDATATDPACSTGGHLRCMEVVDASTQGAPLNPRPTTGRRIFVTSVTGNGQLSSWPDANNVAGTLGGDEICRARARFAGYTNHAAYEALLGTSSTSASTKWTTFTGTWLRPDGTTVATSESDFFDGTQLAAISQTETGAYLAGTAETGGVWTGSTASGGFATFHCASWGTTSGSGGTGRHDLVDLRWATAAVPSSITSCTAVQRLYCYED